MKDALKSLRRHLEQGEVDLALKLEHYLYNEHVKPMEDEDHYYKCFRQWQGDFEQAAARESWVPARGPKVAFIVHNDSPMAHVQVVLKTCELRPRQYEAAVFVMAEDTGRLRKLFLPLGVKVYYLKRGANGVTIQLYRLRQLMAALKFGTLVWVSLPLWASYALATRLAERQVFWSQRFHPLVSPFIDLYICPGRRSESTRVYHGQSWRVVHTPLCLEVGGGGGQPFTQAIPFKPAYGTVGRAEKIAVPAFLEAVLGIVRTASGAGFCHTGRTALPAVTQALQPIPNQFVGWVDPVSYIAKLDVYLETFPLGGLCSQTAWELGVPVVALDNMHSTYGSLEAEGLLSARTVEHYIELAGAVLDPVLRARTVAAQHAALAEERARAREDVEKWWRTVVA